MSRKDIPTAKLNLGASFVAPTPQNTPLVGAPISQISRPTVPDTITEGDADGGEDRFDEDGAYGAVGDRNSAVEEDLPYVVKRRVEGLKGVHVQYMKLEKDYKKELLELDRKYLGVYTPVFHRRRDIIAGSVEPTEDEIARGEAETLKDDPEAVALSATAATPGSDDIKGIPDFWLITLQNHPEIGELVTERDEEALTSLTDIRIEYLIAPSSGYRLIFEFAPNEFFTNTTLAKTYHYEDELAPSGDYTYSRAEGTEIDWKEDKNLTVTIELRKQRNKNTNRFRTIKRSVPTPSFFDFFSPPANPLPEQAESGAFAGAELIELHDRLELDYQIGEDLKENVIPRAIDFYTGKVMEEEMGSAGDEDIEADDDDEAWDDESEEEIPVRSRRQVTKNSGKTDPGECKNQ
ncbi:hypothetical protein FRB95_012782 [Tulasnella sp. JGI-2019a]|nr:hypothetical protein FRB95_012782 [Tulasnella sp. JGI-2019a]